MKGLSLIEVLVAMGIATVAGVLLVAVIVNSTGVFSQQSSKIQTGLNINDAFMQIRSNIKQANSIADQYVNGGDIYTTDDDQLILKVASIDVNNNIVDDAFDYFIVFKDQNILRFRVFPDAASSRESVDRIFSTSLDNITFQYFNSAVPSVEVTPTEAVKVRVSLTLKQKAGAGFETNIATSEANLRNSL